MTLSQHRFALSLSLAPVFRHRPGHALPAEGLRKDELVVILMNNSKTVRNGSIMGVQGLVRNEGVSKSHNLAL